MKHIKIFIILLLFATAHAKEDLSLFYESIDWQMHNQQGVGSHLPSIEGDPGSIVGGCVNAITGKYLDLNVDAITRGPNPLPIYRNYFGNRESGNPNYDDRANLYGFYLNYNYELILDGYVTKDTAWLGNEYGTLLNYKSRHLQLGMTFGLDPQDIESTANFSTGIISGQTHLKNAFLYKIAEGYQANDPDGSIRFFRSQFLGSEIKPSQWLVIHEYKKSAHLGQYSKNPAQTKVFNWIKYSYSGGYIETSNSDGKIFKYYPSVVVNPKRNPRAILLDKVVLPDNTEIQLHHSPLYAFHGKKLPEGRGVYVEFENEKVKKILKPIGTDGTYLTEYTFDYFNNYTDVHDALGNCVRYHFSANHLLTAKEFFIDKRPYAFERNYYEKGNIVCKSLEDASGKLWFCRTFEYDHKGNVLVEKLHGNLTGKCQQALSIQGNGKVIGGECLEKRYSYYGNNFNALSSIEDGKQFIHYTYRPLTNLVTAKYICDNQANNKIVLREFREYDEDHILTKIITDNGVTGEPSDLTGCTERKITKFYPKKEQPGMGQPEIIEELYYDFTSQKEILLKRTLNHYSAQNLVIQQDVYDSLNQYVCTLQKSYDIMDRLLLEKNSEGKTIHYKYDLNGNLIKKIEEGRETAFTYDFSNRLISKEEKNRYGKSRIERFRYDLMGNRIAQIDTCGNETTFSYDALGRKVEIHPPFIADEKGEIKKFTIFNHYDIAGNITASTDEMGFIKTTDYNTRNQPTKVTFDGASEYYEYDLYGNLIKTLSKNGTATLYAYDFLNRLISKQYYSANGENLGKITHEYDAFHLIKTIDQEGNETRYSYDGAGREKAIFKPLGAQTEKEYDTLGRVCKIKEWYDQDAYTVRSSLYDLEGRVVQQTLEDAQGHCFEKQTCRYDLFGNQIEKTQHFDENRSSTTYISYDDFNRPLESINALADVKKTIYEDHFINESGQNVLHIKQIDEMGIVTLSTYNARQQIASIERKNTSGISLQKQTFFYDGCGNRILEKLQAIDPSGNVKITTHQYQYDPSHRPIALIEEADQPHARRTQFAYDAAGQLISKKTIDTELIYQYDGLGRMVFQKALSLTTSVDPSSHSFSYNKKGLLLSVENLSTQKITLRRYDALDRLVQETQESGFKISYTYDLQGRRTALHLPDGTAIHYSYQGPYLASLSYNNLTHEYLSYDMAGNVLSSRLVGAAGKVSHSYDKLDRSNRIQHKCFMEEIPSNGFDAYGNRTLLNRSDNHGKASCSYNYDENYQLQSEEGMSTHSYSYDSHYNRISKDQQKESIGPFNQLLSQGKSTFEWDKRGNLLKNAAETYAYDPLNQLIAFKKEQLLAQYSYDGLYRRMSKQLNLSSKEYTPIFYLYDGQNEIGVIDHTGKIVELRLLGVGLGAEIGATVAMKLDEAFYAVLNDLSGNISCLIDPQSGIVAESYRYSAFGEEQFFDSHGQTISFSFLQNPWRFSSKRIDEESKLVYFGRRYYLSQIGRFVTADPLGYHDGPNLYSYVHNNPLTHFDLYGLKSNESRMGEGGSRPTLVRSVYDALSYCVRGIGRAIEWIGKNLVPIPGLRETVEATGRFARGGHFVQRHDSKKHSHFGSVGSGFIPGLINIFINGVWNDLKSCQENTQSISDKLDNTTVFYVYNSTHGLLQDLFDCIFARLGIPTAVERQIGELLSYIRKECLTEKQWESLRIVIHAHSQGAMHLYNQLKGLPSNAKRSIDVHTYGPGTILENRGFNDVQNWISKLDFVPLNDALHYGNGLFGKNNNVHFLEPKTHCPYLEHSFLGQTYQNQLLYICKNYLRDFKK